MMSREQESSTRRILITMLKKQGPLSVNEMSRQLGITEMAIRRHLNTLERDGLIETSLVRQSMGRPTHVYSLTEAADELFPKNYHHLALDFLEELESGEGREAVGRLFEKRKLKLFDKYGDQMKGKALQERVSALADIQNANGYMVEWEPSDNGRYILNEYNCPISQVANHYDQACSCELSLFEKLLETDVERTECLAKGGNKCTYVIAPGQLSAKRKSKQ